MVEYLRVSANHRSADSIRYFVKELRSSFEGRAMEGLRGAHIAAHITRRPAEGVKDSSINRELEVLSAAINHARYHLEWNLPNPVLGRMLKEPEGRVRWISREEAVLLLEAARASRSPYLADLIVLALNTGMKAGGNARTGVVSGGLAGGSDPFGGPTYQGGQAQERSPQSSSTRGRDLP